MNLLKLSQRPRIQEALGSPPSFFPESGMNYEQFNHFCSRLVGTSYVKQWGDAHVWKVSGKVFAIGGWDEGTPAFTFKVSDNHFNILQDETGFKPAPYMASRGMKWIQQYESGRDDDELIYYITESYRLVSLGLTKKRRKELGLDHNQVDQKKKSQ